MASEEGMARGSAPAARRANPLASPRRVVLALILAFAAGYFGMAALDGGSGTGATRAGSPAGTGVVLRGTQP